MKIHFIGIGGIGISGIASIYKQKGNIVSGSDEEASEITADLKKQGIGVFIGHKKTNIGDSPGTVPDLVIYSEAVPKSNIELKEAKQLKIKCLSGAMALAELAKDYFLIAVSGMHGKSTTASMISQILIKAGLDPTFIIGTKPGWRLGKSKYLIIEADDYQAKFLNYRPNILVLTNIEEEHMDYFQNLNHIMRIFRQYVGQVKDCVVANRDDKNVVKVLENIKYKSKNLNIKKPKTVFYSLRDKDAIKIKKILKVPGEHNISNALAALSVAKILGIKKGVALKAPSEYRGVWRRFEESELKIKNLKFKIISDYAHHPTEIKATFQALKERYGSPSASLRANPLGVKRTWVVFQPHQYQRTFYLFDSFVKTFQQAKNKFGIEKIIITDIYSVKGRESENIKKKVNSQKLVKAINRDFVEYIEQRKIGDYIKKNASDDMILAIIGAGDIYKLPNNL
ncbi:MAG: UDP-N-acetylmuramate--L-alanine ligase [Candidatus Pacebacteria bacterium]|nr:UDP-N-acetylmuramate--L-alanine ligase [Candidatus Paceibacterota bacterium]